MALVHHFRFMAQHHRLCTGRLLRYLMQVSTEKECAFAFDGGGSLFFGSVHATLNHLIGAEALWYTRLTGWEEQASEGVAQLYNLDGAELQQAWLNFSPDIGPMREQIARQSNLWCTLLSPLQEGAVGQPQDGATDKWLLDEAKYVDTEGNECSIVRAAGLSQVFQHASYHRGQISAALHYHQQLTLGNGGTGDGSDNVVTPNLPVMDMQNMGAAFLGYDTGFGKPAPTQAEDLFTSHP